MIYQNILGTIGRTPIVKLNRMAPEGIDIYVKVEAFNPMASVKDRLAYAVIKDARDSGELQPGQTVVEATSGNTGIALAMVCAVYGHPFVATMAESFSIERRKLMRAFGAKVILTPAAERGTGMVRLAEELSEEARLVPGAPVRESRRTPPIIAQRPARRFCRILPESVWTIGSPAGVPAAPSPARER